MIEHDAPEKRPAKRLLSGVAQPLVERAPEALIQRLRRTLADSFVPAHQTGRQASGPLSADALAYVTSALDILEQLTSSEIAAPLQLAPVELADVLMQLLAAWKVEAPRHSLELALPGDSPTALADESIVTQVTRLVLATAIALAPHGGSVRVSLRTHGDGALIGVRQFETVLPEERLVEIFEPFPRVPELDASQQAALLSLAVARRLVESHGGCIWAETPTRADGLVIYVWWANTPTLPPEPAAVNGEQPLAPDRLPLNRREPVLLVLEEDARMARYLRANMAARGYQAHLCETADDALDCIDREEPDLLLVDGGIPAIEDTSLLARLRQYVSAPILILAQSADARDCARLLDAGAADYISRPFNIEELMARVRVALRAAQPSQEAGGRSGLVRVGSLEIDSARHQVRERGRSVALSRTEYRLLRALAQHPGMVVSHSQLLERVWGASYSQETEFLWVYIRRLRRKIEPDPAHPRYILTAPGMGYQLADIPQAMPVAPGPA